MASGREDLQAFAADLFDGFFRADQRRWGQAYWRGLLLDGRRKSVQPMPARLGEDGNRQALAYFVTSSLRMCGARLAWRMQDGVGRGSVDRGWHRLFVGRGWFGFCVAAVHRHRGQGHHMRRLPAPGQ
ncbi:transposase [Streptomyces sp. NPDC058676]|uniref:transposase n=1 Tax=unclassified Streptomyces TaxID=2593676 RepID=UPI00364CEF6A